MKDLMLYAVDQLHEKGAEYGDIRIGFYRNQSLSTRDQIVSSLNDAEDSGIGIRYYRRGGWGFVSSPLISKTEIDRLIVKAAVMAEASSLGCSEPITLVPVGSYNARWSVPFDEDPFAVSNREKIDLLLAINSEMRKVPNIHQAVSSMSFNREHKLFASTVGTVTDQLLMRAYVSYTATAVGPERFETRSYQDMPLNEGYEHVRNAPLVENARRVAEEAVAKLRAADCPEKITDLILLPSHTCLVIHETIGHATELDRVMGWEADFAGTSFATPEKLGNFSYGSPKFNVVADRTRQHGRATVMFDDDGVPTQEWHLIKDGILRGYSTTRATADLIGETASRGCSFADSWFNAPILRMPNVSIEPGAEGSPSLSDLISGTDEGILIDGTGSFSIDHQRINFQFGGDACWEIKHGKIGSIMRRVTYQSHNPEFWRSVDEICGLDEWQMFGVVNCGKGQPMQVAQLTHGSAPLRLRHIRIGRARI